MDNLSGVLNHLSISARVFYTGAMCGISNFNEPQVDQGHIHLVKQGQVKIESTIHPTIEVNEPTLIFCPKPFSHRIVSQPDSDAELVCASVEIGSSSSNPIANALPDFVVVPLASSEMLEHSVAWLFKEAFQEQQARQPMLDRLSEIVIIQLLRYVLEKEQSLQGLLRGLTHPQISKLIQALHQQPEKNWNLEEMASIAAMSRSKFAQIFKDTLNQTPADYLSDWRISIAQTYLDKGYPVNWVANKVGYENSSVLARVFKKKTGISPSQWRQRKTGMEPVD